MKRLTYSILAALSLIVCACNVNDSDVVPSDSDKCPLPKNLTVCIQNPQTRISVGELNPATNTYPVTLTPYNPDTDEGDHLLFMGLKGDISQYDDSAVTLSAWYVVESSYGNISDLRLENLPENYRAGYEAADYFIITTPFDIDLYQYDKDEISTGLMMINWFSKEQLAKLSEQGGPMIPLYPLNSLLKLHLSIPAREHELMISEVYAFTPGNHPRKTPDIRRLPEILKDQIIYTVNDEFNNDYTYTYLGQSFTGNFDKDVYMAIDPGTYGSINLKLLMEDNEYSYDLQIDSKKGCDIKLGCVYTSDVTITDEMLRASRSYIPVILADGNSFRFTDPDYGKENAKKIRSLFATTPVVFAGYGMPSDYASGGGVDAAGKIVVVSRGQNSFAEKIVNAENAGALGIIIYNNQPGDVNMDISSLGDRPHIPVIATTQDFGAYLKEHSDIALSIRMDD